MEAGDQRSPAPRSSSLRKRGRPVASPPPEDAAAVDKPSTKRPRPLPRNPARPSAKKPARASSKKPARSPPKKKATVMKPKGKEPVVEDDDVEEDGDEEEDGDNTPDETVPAEPRKAAPKKRVAGEGEFCFIGNPIPEAEAKRRWPQRYSIKVGSSLSTTTSENTDPDDRKARRHYEHAKVDGEVYNLNDDVYVQAVEGEDNYIGRIVEFFEGSDKQLYFTAQWFFRAKDTVIKNQTSPCEDRRVFFSEEKNVNVLDCILSKITIAKVSPNIDLDAKVGSIPFCDLYYDMSYSLAYSTFANLPIVVGPAGSETSTISSEGSITSSTNDLFLLDLYSGCGAMSTGLSFGANIAGINLVTKWAVDLNKYACESLAFNHPETEVRNEKAEDFLSLLREWENLCNQNSVLGTEISFGEVVGDDNEEPEESDGESNGEFEVEKIVGICFGDPHKTGKVGLKFKVRWKGYGEEEDTWEPMEGLSKCEGKISDFVRSGYQKKILPLPGTVDVICGGPPCQGISGHNRFRKMEDPLSDPKNQQMLVFMDIVDYLKPKYVLMENVVDILKMSKGLLGRFALGRLVGMNYQARLGIIGAGCFGLPQFRLRCFLWGAHPSQKLPLFPLPTHNVVVRGGVPNEFKDSLVAYYEHEDPGLETALILEDAISDLPSVTNAETRDTMTYGGAAITEFQRFIRLTRQELLGSASPENDLKSKAELFDHRPLQLNVDDYQRVCRIPKKKKACFRDLPGLVIGEGNVVKLDPDAPREVLPSGKFLVPDYAISFVKGKSLKPFGRLWWDETVPTVLARAEPHNQIILHPNQDRVLTIRENARLQGFPDFYKLFGPVKERYTQVGNAVAVPVAQALGYSLGLAYQGEGSDQPLFSLPKWYSQRHVARSAPVASTS